VRVGGKTLSQRVKFAVINLFPGFVLAVIWEVSARLAENGIFRFGSPSAVIRVAYEDLGTKAIYFDIALTGLETVLGLMFGSLLGTLVGLLFWIDARLGKISQPYISIAGAIPIFALAPLLINWFGIGLTAKVVMASFSTFLVAIVQAYEGAREADLEQLEFAKALRAKRFRVLRLIVFPGAAAWVLAGVRLNIGFALIGAFIGEFVSSEAGLGRYILRNGGLYDIPRVLFGIALLASTALALNRVISLLARRWTNWRG
jgi:NitT/TauT family transport system permease protein